VLVDRHRAIDARVRIAVELGANSEQRSTLLDEFRNALLILQHIFVVEMSVQKKTEIAYKHRA